MSTSDVGIVTIPARITAQDLADAIGREVSEILTVLAARNEHNSPEDFLSAEVAVGAAAALGVEVAIEFRDLALETLYVLETVGRLEELPEGRAGHLVRGVTARIEDLDRMIESTSEHWSVARMPVVDRNILRIGLFELSHERGTPTGVIVAEAVRLAKTYSTERSGSFVNGVLAALAQEVRGG